MAMRVLRKARKEDVKEKQAKQLKHNLSCIAVQVLATCTSLFIFGKR